MAAGRPAGPVLVTGRDPIIDFLRALALVSMVSGHTELSTLTARVLHSPRWIDGAFIFVALSGFVTGLVHRRIRRELGVRASTRKLVRRSGRIYAVHVGLCLASIAAVSAFRQAQLPNTPTWSAAGGMLSATGKVLLLRIEPNYTEILPLYVVCLLLTVALALLLDRGWWWLVLGLSAAAYLSGWHLRGLAFAPATLWVTSWQALFVAGLVVGWSWEHERHRVPLRWRSLGVVLCTAGAIAIYGLALTNSARTRDVLGHALGRRGAGPAALLFAAMAIVALYAGLRRAWRGAWVRRVLTPVRVLGAKGLPGYAAMVLTLIAVSAVPGLPHNDLMVLAVLVVCGLAEYTALRLDQRRRLGRAARTTPAGLLLEAPAARVDPG